MTVTFCIFTVCKKYFFSAKSHQTNIQLDSSDSKSLESLNVYLNLVFLYFDFFSFFLSFFSFFLSFFLSFFFLPVIFSFSFCFSISYYRSIFKYYCLSIFQLNRACLKRRHVYRSCGWVAEWSKLSLICYKYNKDIISLIILLWASFTRKYGVKQGGLPQLGSSKGVFLIGFLTLRLWPLS